jgi:hypothetical protein
MITKKSMLDTIIEALCGSTISKEKNEDTLVSFGNGYEEYLKKSPEYHDQVIRSMYKGTRFENESPEKLRQILRAQVSVREEIFQ